MVDIHLLEASLEKKKPEKDSLAWLIKCNYDDIFTRHSVKREDFMHTFDFYERHPERMDALMNRVIDELNKMDAEIRGGGSTVQDKTKKP
ncbi:MAG: hypothetical protein KatS3mg031_0003 [Chitinophagales bacterium]|nr:MAG: hypothetical protein KatS3mg031_0003 [Chitinophagales bacterium]